MKFVTIGRHIPGSILLADREVKGDWSGSIVSMPCSLRQWRG